MKKQSQSEEEQTLPSIYSRKTVRDVLNIIKVKKNQYQKQLESNHNAQIQQSQLKTTFRQNFNHSIIDKPIYRDINSLRKKTQQPNNIRNSKINISCYHLDNRTKNSIANKRSVQYSIPSINNQENIKQQFERQLKKIPKDSKQRNQQNLKQLLRILSENNPFFIKIHPLIAICLLKMNRIVERNPSTLIYRANEQHSAVYIILFGRIKISNKDTGMKKICYPGQVIGEQCIFSQKTKKQTLQKSVVVSHSLLLQIKIQNLNKMGEEMIKFGYKIPYSEMQTVLRRNYIVKNWKRTKNNRCYTKN